MVSIGAGIGIKLLADKLDQPPIKVADQAPWTGNHRAPTRCSRPSADQLAGRAEHPLEPQLEVARIAVDGLERDPPAFAGLSQDREAPDSAWASSRSGAIS